MLSRPGPALRLGLVLRAQWDGFRALVATEEGLEVRSRRGWNMTPVLPELRASPAGLVLDGELVAWRESEPYFPLVCRPVLNRDMSIPLTFVIFDLLRRDGVHLTSSPYLERRQDLERAPLEPVSSPPSETPDRGSYFPATSRTEEAKDGLIAADDGKQPPFFANALQLC